MRVVLVTGGRAYANKAKVYRVLSEEAPDLVVHGGAKTYDTGRTVYGQEREHCGADYFAGKWADDHDVPQLKAPYVRVKGKAGGPIRNSWMVDLLASLEVDNPLRWEIHVVAFPGGSGTADTIAKARRKGFFVREIQ